MNVININIFMIIINGHSHRLCVYNIRIQPYKSYGLWAKNMGNERQLDKLVNSHGRICLSNFIYHVLLALITNFIIEIF